MNQPNIPSNPNWVRRAVLASALTAGALLMGNAHSSQPQPPEATATATAPGATPEIADQPTPFPTDSVPALTQTTGSEPTAETEPTLTPPRVEIGTALEVTAPTTTHDKPTVTKSTEQPTEEVTTQPTAEQSPLQTPEDNPDARVYIEPEQGETTRLPLYPDIPPIETAPPLQTLEKPSLPPEVAKLMASETVNIAGCSGFLVRNTEGKPIGALTAEHCGWRDINSRRLTGSDGLTYIVRYGSVEAKVGDVTADLQPVGAITKVLAQPSGDKSRDTAFVAFGDHTIEEVLANYQHLSEAEIAQLKLGDTMFLSGWPAAQPKHPEYLNEERQSFALKVLGTETITLTSGETIQMVTAVLPRNDNQTQCSFGDSGGEGFVLTTTTGPDGTEQTVARSVGTLAGFDDFDGLTYRTKELGESIRTYYQNKFHVDLSDYTSVCMFAYQVTPPAEGGVTLHLVNSYSDVPGYTEAVQSQVSHEFLAADARRDIIDGLVKVTLLDQSDNPSPHFWLDRPAIVEDPVSGQLLLVGYSPKSADQLNIISLEHAFMDIYGRTPDAKASVIQSTGKLVQATDKTGQTLNAFEDDKGLVFGQNVSEPTSLSNPFTIYQDKSGQWVTEEMQVGVNKGGGKGGGDGVTLK